MGNLIGERRIMEVITLSKNEREKFIKYLEFQVYVDSGINEQMKKVGIPDAVIKQLNSKSAAYIIVADDLRKIEDF
jgi:hypothetical protein